jgi:hypothetical protein
MKLSWLQCSFLFIIIAFALCIPAFYNGFPLFFPDSMGYIISGFRDSAGNTRLWLYGGFVRHISLWETLWLVPFAQGLILSGTVYLMFKYFFRKKYAEISFVVYLLLVSATTALSFHVSMIMPDIFTPIVILSFCILLLATQLSKKDYIVAIFLFLLSSGMHNSHTLLNLSMIFVIVFSGLIKKWRPTYQRLGITFRKIVGMVVLVFASYLTTCTIQYSKGGDFAGTRGGGIFLFARLCDFGLAQNYLKEHCDEVDSDICHHIGSIGLGRYFLWSRGSYLNRSGTWHWSEEKVAFYNELCWKILTKPKYLKKYVIRCIEATVMQVLCFDYNNQEDLINAKENGLMKAIQPYFPDYYLAAEYSRQIQKMYSDEEINLANSIQKIVLYISALIVLLFLFFDKKYSEKQKAIVLVLLLGILANAFIVGAASGVYDRYQSRVAWLITLPAFWWLWSKMEVLQAMLKNKLEE